MGQNVPNKIIVKEVCGRVFNIYTDSDMPTKNVKDILGEYYVNVDNSLISHGYLRTDASLRVDEEYVIIDRTGVLIHNLLKDIIINGKSTRLYTHIYPDRPFIGVESSGVLIINIDMHNLQSDTILLSCGDKILQPFSVHDKTLIYMIPPLSSRYGLSINENKVMKYESYDGTQEFYPDTIYFTFNVKHIILHINNSYKDIIIECLQ